MVVLGLAAVAAPGVAIGQPARTFYERTAISAADERCRLFSSPVSAALAAGAAQARGAALRAGSDTRSLTDLERRARAYAATLDCRSPAVLAEANRVEQAYAGYQRVTRMTYPGDVADWRADRGVGRTARWRLAQDARFGADAMTFGLAGKEGVSALVAVARFSDQATPYAARLVLRDTGRTMGPYLPGQDKSALARKLPPRASTRSFMAEARSAAEPELLPRGSEGGLAFRFPAEAAQALAELDPREAIAVEFLFPNGVRTAYVEVGDFAAGRAFLKMASR